MRIARLLILLAWAASSCLAVVYVSPVWAQEVLQRNQRGRGMPANLDMSEEEYAKALLTGIEIKWQAKLDPATRQVRVIALDRNSNLAGTVTMPLDPNP